MCTMAMTIRPATTPADIAQAQALFLEYAAESKLDLCFQGFEEELAALPGKYAPPGGRLLLACEGDLTAGCGALRELSEGVCEMKRLFVRPAFRTQGVGRDTSPTPPAATGRPDSACVRGTPAT